MFVKIKNIPPEEIPVSGHTEYVKYGLGEGCGFKGIRYTDFVTRSLQEKTLLGLIPEKHRKDFRLSLMSINRDILPHTDSDTKTAINWYLTAGGYKTSFCMPKHGARSFKLPTQTDGVVYDFSDVIINKTFEAEDGDIYVLDVTKLHCVQKDDGELDRIALNLATNIHFKEVLDLLRGYNVEP
jgi:hypothetical protein